MSSFSRILAILDLFTEARPIWHSDDIMAALNYSRPTAYRYIKDLAASGYLQRVAAARYALGPRLIELDYLVRNSDPVLIAAMPVMDDLARQAGLDAVQSDNALSLTYGRGRRRPLFQGASPKMILAHLSRADAVKLYKSHAPEIAQLGLGGAWPEFRDQLSIWRKAGVYVSLGEVEPGACAIAAPILNPIREVVAALALVAAPDRFDSTRVDEMRRQLLEACRRIESTLAESSRALTG
jgi:DNA-binding IclR family transcriptional regulator